MKTKQEIKEWLLENASNEYGRIDLSGLDFEELKVDFSGIKAEYINNHSQEAKNIYNHSQEAKNIYNQSQEATDIYNHSQKATDIYNNGQLIKKPRLSYDELVEIVGYEFELEGKDNDK
jgi:hypothetical protein